MSVRVAAIDDDKMLLQGLQAWLAPLDDIEFVAAEVTVEAFVDARHTVDVVLLDLNLRDGSRPEENVKKVLATGAAVLVVSTNPDQEQVLATLGAGASGYITKDNDLPVLMEAVRHAAAGTLEISPELAFLLSTDKRPQRPQLSSQEALVLRVYASGATLAATARKAGVAYGTAREYLERVKRKYSEAGWPTHTKLDLVERLREEELGD